MLENFSIAACKIISSIIENISPKKELIVKGSPSIYLDDLKEIMYLTPYIEANFMKYIPRIFCFSCFGLILPNYCMINQTAVEELIPVAEKLKSLEKKYNGCTSFEMLQSNEFSEFH